MSEVPELWPDPAAMHNYLERWRVMYEDLKEKYQTAIKSNREAIDGQNQELRELRSQLANATTPFKEAALEQQLKIRILEGTVAELKQKISTATSRLGSMLEVTVVPNTDLSVLVDNALVLIDETKKQFRETIDASRV